MLCRFLVVVLTVFAVACGAPNPPGHDVAVSAAGTGTGIGGEELDRLYADYWDEYLQLDPITATFSGDSRYDDRLPNFLAAEHRQRLHEFRRRWLDRLQAVDASQLEDQARLSHQILSRSLQEQMEGERFPDWMLPLNQFFSFPNYLMTLGSGAGPQPFETVRDYENWLARGTQAPALFDQAIANMREGMAAGIVQPRVLMERMLPQMDAAISDEPEKTPFWQPISNMPPEFSDADRARLGEAYRAMLAEHLIPAYRRLRAFLADEYIPAARDTHGLGALPDGSAWYTHQVRTMTTTDLSPEKIHEIGLGEVARIRAEMDRVREQVAFDGDLRAFMKHMASDPAFAFRGEQDMLDQYQALKARVDEKIPELFSVIPGADLDIRPVESFRAATEGAASYLPPSQDGSRPGIFYVNTFDLPKRRTWAKETLYLHEGVPGHHFQLALQQELTGVPEFRRSTLQVVYVEGWALYAESLGRELGLYTDPYQYYGRLSEEAKRAARLVVDTGLHHGGWTRDQVIDYLVENAGLADTEALAQAERYMAWPGQALGYKLGELKIAELRREAEQALGGEFDARDFHAQILGDGSLPLDVLEAKMDRWIQAKRQEAD